MPELPEIEVLRQSLETVLPGDRIRKVEVANPALREPVDEMALKRTCTDRRVLAVRRRAKYLLIDLEKEHTLVIHLGMSGRLTRVSDGVPANPHEHVAFHLDSGVRIRLCDPRRFGLVFVVSRSQIDVDRRFAHLGVEPLRTDPLGEVFATAARRRRGPVKGLLMDARVVVGIGNIYASEALFRAGIHPARSVARISARRWNRLGCAVQEVLRDAIAAGGTTLRDYVDSAGDRGDFQIALAVYGREGMACTVCDRDILRRVQAGRSTFYCPGCQH